MCAPIPSRHTHAIKVNTTCRRRVRITQNFIGLLLLSYLMVFFSSSRSAHFQACIRSAFVRRVSMMRFSTFFFSAFPRRGLSVQNPKFFCTLCLSLFKIQKRETLSTRNARAFPRDSFDEFARRLKKDAPNKSLPFVEIAFVKREASRFLSQSVYFSFATRRRLWRSAFTCFLQKCA